MIKGCKSGVELFYLSELVGIRDKGKTEGDKIRKQVSHFLATYFRWNKKGPRINAGLFKHHRY